MRQQFCLLSLNCIWSALYFTKRFSVAFWLIQTLSWSFIEMKWLKKLGNLWFMILMHSHKIMKNWFVSTDFRHMFFEMIIRWLFFEFFTILSFSSHFFIYHLIESKNPFWIFDKFKSIIIFDKYYLKLARRDFISKAIYQQAGFT